MWKRFISEYLSFTKKERSGNIALLSLIVILIILPFLYPFFIQQKPVDASEFKKQIEILSLKKLDSSDRYLGRNYNDDNSQSYRQSDEKNYYGNRLKGTLFYFNPNTLDEAGWKRLGIKDKTVKTIQNYIAKGGRFYTPADIGKIWGLHEDEVQKLIPFVQIQNSNNVNDSEKKLYETKPYEKEKYVVSVIDINAADTTTLIALPGIGSKLSQRILSFRDKLGGFYKIEQIGETYGLPDSTFQKIKNRFSIKSNAVQQININTATVDEMKVHPYLRYPLANAIVQYRMQHGAYILVDDIKKIMLVTEDVFNKIGPYLKVN
jgi:DNA uptake protein ComE-like DNA-binding protein